MRRTFIALAFVALGAACAAGKENPITQDPGATAGSGGSLAGSGGSGGAGAGGSGTAGDGGGSGSPADGGFDINLPDGSNLDNILLYAHTNDTLYQLDPQKLEDGLAPIGTFDCVGGEGQDKDMTDVAVDRDQNLWAVSHTGVHHLVIQDGKAHCEKTIPLQSLNPDPAAVFYGLTFAPAGTLDPDKEVLVASNTAGELWAVDDQGKQNFLGHFGVVPTDDGHNHFYPEANVGKRWELSGDLVFLSNNGDPLGFATVRDCPSPPSNDSCNTVNTLIEIDMKKLGKAAPGTMTKAVRGQIVARKGCDDGLQGNYGNMYGIAAWNDKVYGFSRSNHLVDISINDGSSCLVHTFPSVGFAGAGVTTLAPVKPPIN